MSTRLRRLFLATVCIGLAAVATGCASSAKPARTAALISAEEARRVTIIRGDGTTAAWSDLVSAAAGAEAILVGENHGHPLGLAAASALWTDLLARSPSAALAMEFFERDEQSRLDDYLTGVNDEAAFRKRAQRNDSNYPPGHRAMVEAAKAAHRPVIAANAPRPYVHLARTDGYERLATLTPEQRRLFRIPDSVPARDNPYRRAFDKVMQNAAGPTHGTRTPGDKPPAQPDAAAIAKAEEERSTQLDAGFRAQSLWDWTMADSVARAVSDGNHPVLLVVGRFHIDHQGGLPQALAGLRSGTRILTVSFVDENAPATGTPHSSDKPTRESDKDRADFIVYVGPSR